MKIDPLTPAIFVLLWSTGWVVAKFAAPHADPLTFLSARYAAAIVAFAIVIAIVRLRQRQPQPQPRLAWKHAIFSGVFLHGLYLGGVWWAIAEGVPASISGLIAALQPLLTAAIAPFIVGERLRPSQTAGVVLGFLGLALAILPGLLALDPVALRGQLVPLLVNILGMMAVTAGTIYQKRHLQQGDLRSIALLQYVGALAVTLPIAFWLEDMRFDVNIQSILALLWSVLGLSLVSVALLLYLIRRGQVSRAASLVYLVPPAVAVQSWLYFGDPLTPPMLAGTVIVVFGVWLTNRRPPLRA
ncbi:DMT family transporter [Pseudohoeflea coraliihabitans]|uniref:DMT family transporter n=1 Tax=Pseudohoeflea coraliihabitans TaxID=2860393 RepID=A0ABS6WM46_9HYPH|nr:DMT family transporter [Pseudohoeflea sp. DP4N28-3]MBW3097006.1 DMT family transporter [Pseudohoeflea sp. DP4N28-3]